MVHILSTHLEQGFGKGIDLRAKGHAATLCKKVSCKFCLVFRWHNISLLSVLCSCVCSCVLMSNAVQICARGWTGSCSLQHFL